MPSLSYELAKKIIAKVGHKQVFEMDYPTMLNYLEQHDGQQDNKPPAWISAQYHIATRQILGSPCYVINRKYRPKANRPIVLFTHGGGFMFEASVAHWLVVDKIIRRTGAEVWFCVYQLLPKSTLFESSTVVYETYLQMLEVYGENRIIAIGDSAGAILTLNLAHWLCKPQINLPRPKKLILVSPGRTLVRDQEVRTQMDAISPFDVMLNTGLMDVLNKIMPMRPDYDEFYTYPLNGDFSKFPPMLVFSGTREIFYPQMADFLKLVRNAEVPITFFQGIGLCHCWPYVPLVPECERGFNQIIKAIKH
jgi:acetyl esterase/lipase